MEWPAIDAPGQFWLWHEPDSTIAFGANALRVQNVSRVFCATLAITATARNWLRKAHVACVVKLGNSVEPGGRAIPGASDASAMKFRPFSGRSCVGGGSGAITMIDPTTGGGDCVVSSPALDAV
jgi:hypothetical protein